MGQQFQLLWAGSWAIYVGYTPPAGCLQHISQRLVTGTNSRAVLINGSGT